MKIFKFKKKQKLNLIDKNLAKKVKVHIIYDDRPDENKVMKFSQVIEKHIIDTVIIDCRIAF
jgi:hypothetical protein